MSYCAGCDTRHSEGDTCPPTIEDLQRDIEILVSALIFYADKTKYERREDWIYNGEDEVKVNADAFIVSDEGTTALEALSKTGFQPVAKKG